MKSLIAATLAAGALLAGAAHVSADTQPTGGTASIGRNEQGSAGPHCHWNLVASEHNAKFDLIFVFPSHKAHVATGTPTNIFQADINCDGIQGN